MDSPSTPAYTDTRIGATAPTKTFGKPSRKLVNMLETPSPAPMQHFDEDREPPSTPKRASPVRDGENNSQREDDAQERARREEEESIALARALMAEEAMAVSYAMSMDYITNNRDEFSEEDLAALQAAMQEDEQEAVEELEEEEGDTSMSYEMMLRLGERLGDVKSERWSRIAKEKINALPTFSFDPVTAVGKDENDCEVKCLVCQFAYEKGENLRRLPCNHCFHTECVDQWLMTKDFCPYCRTAIVKEEEEK